MRRLNVLLFLLAGVCLPSVAHATHTLFLYLLPLENVPVGAYVDADSFFMGHHWQILDHGDPGTPSAHDTGANLAGGSGRELALSGGAQLDYRGSSGFFLASFNFRLTLPAAVSTDLLKLNNVDSSFADLITAGSGTVAGMSYSVGTHPDGHYSMALQQQTLFGQSFALIGDTGITVDDIELTYLPEPTASALILPCSLLALRRRQRG